MGFQWRYMCFRRRQVTASPPMRDSDHYEFALPPTAPTSIDMSGIFDVDQSISDARSVASMATPMKVHIQLSLSASWMRFERGFKAPLRATMDMPAGWRVIKDTRQLSGKCRSARKINVPGMINPVNYSSNKPCMVFR